MTRLPIDNLDSFRYRYDLRLSGAGHRPGKLIEKNRLCFRRFRMQRPTDTFTNRQNLGLPDQFDRLFRRDPDGPERHDLLPDALENRITIRNCGSATEHRLSPPNPLDNFAASIIINRSHNRHVSDFKKQPFVALSYINKKANGPKSPQQ